MIYLTKAIEKLSDKLSGPDAATWLDTRHRLLRWIEGQVQEGRPAICGRLAEEPGNEFSALGLPKEIKAHIDLKLGFGGKRGDQVRCWRIAESERLPRVEWRELSITNDDWARLQSLALVIGPEADHPPLAPAEAASSPQRARGRKPKQFLRVKSEMANDIRLADEGSGIRDPRKMIEKQWEDNYRASRDTCRKALRAAVSENCSGTNSDK